MTEQCVKNNVGLEFPPGEFRLFSVRLPMLVSTSYFLDCDAEREPSVLADELGDEVKGLLFRSYPVKDRLPSLSFTHGMLRYVSSHYRRSYIVLEGTFEEYLGKFSAKSRQTLRRKVRRYANFCGGSIDIRSYRTPEEMPEFVKLAWDVSKSYQEKRLGPGLPDPSRFAEVAVRMAMSDGVRGYLLFHGSCPVAYLYCSACKGILLSLSYGYDPAYGCWSPGTVLQYCLLEQLFAESTFQLLDFNVGESPHRVFYATRSPLCADIYYLRCSLTNLLLVTSHLAVRASSDAIARLLDAIYLKDRAKWLIRGQSSLRTG